MNMTEEMLNPTSFARQVKDQIALAKAFIVIAKESKNIQFAWDLSAQIRNSQLLFSIAAASRRPVTVLDSEPTIRDMASLEGHLSSVTEKSAKYAQIAAEEGKLAERSYAVASKLTDNSLYHFCVFSDNIVATLVVVNSTALNSKGPEKVAFDLVSNEINYAAMKSWFAMNMDNLTGVTAEVRKFEDFKWLNASYVPVLKQLLDSDTQSYYLSGHNNDGRTPIKFRNPKYLSMLNHLSAQLYLFIRPYKRNCKRM
ncbi:hypothetical protein Bca101_097754 [Brassica carinata]